MKYEEMLSFINDEIRKQKLTQTHIANEAFITPQALNNYLMNERMMPAVVMLDVLTILGKPIQVTFVARTVNESKMVIANA